MNLEENSHHASCNDPTNNMYDEHSYNNNKTLDSNNSTVYTSPRSKRRAIAEFMKLDPGYRCIGKKNKLEYFSTVSSPGTPIRNAITGVREYNLKVGNIVAESQFFKVHYAGNGITSVIGPDTLFYDNPEQYERHMNCSVKPAIKEKWEKNYDMATHPTRCH